MSLRWRKSGELLCGAKSKAEEGDTYIDDRLHYELSVIQKTVVPDNNEKENGKWYWSNINYYTQKTDGFSYMFVDNYSSPEREENPKVWMMHINEENPYFELIKTQLKND